MTLRYLSSEIKKRAALLGFSACGIAPAQPVDEDAHYLKEWLEAGYHAGMTYMEEHFEKRCNPCMLVEGAKSVISLALNYFPERRLEADQWQVAYYAYGQDYHLVMKEKLISLLTYIREELLPVDGRVFCDTAPLLERYWAHRAGLGWIGKNTQLIIPDAGSYFFLGELVVDAVLDYDLPMKNRCGHCTRCLESCPTRALEKAGLLNANKCLSYLTIEHKGAIPPSLAERMGTRIYGCDQCQQVCPWNGFALPHRVVELQASDSFLNMRPADWCSLSVEQYRALFKKSAMKRAKYEGLMRNVFAKQQAETKLKKSL